MCVWTVGGMIVTGEDNRNDRENYTAANFRTQMYINWSGIKQKLSGREADD